MADKKISQLTASTTPLAGTEVLPVVQGGVTKQVSVANLTAGRVVSASNALIGQAASIYGEAGRGAVEINGSSSSLLALNIGDAAANGTYLVNSATELAMVVRDARPYIVSVNGAERLRISDTGNLGLGVASPLAKIHGVVPFVANNNAEVFRMTDDAACDFKVLLDRKNNLSDSISRINTAAGNMAFEVNSAERIRIDSSGNVGVGTATPGAPLEVNRASDTFNPTGNSITLLNNPHAAGQSPLDWVINGTLRSRIRTDFVGNVNYVANGGSHVFMIGGDAGVGAQSFVLDTAGNATLKTGNLVIGTSGKGIDFSADGQAAGMTSELLDDYEEGTWTPIVTFGGGSENQTYDTTYNGATYTKIGNRVFVSGHIELTNKGTSTGIAAIAGLPFVSSGGTKGYLGASLSKSAGVSFSGFPSIEMDPASSAFLFANTTDAGAAAFLTDANFASAAYIYFSGHYTVA